MRPESFGIEYVQARRAELEDMMERTRARIEAADAAMATAHEFSRALEQKLWTQPIQPDLGTLQIDGTGRLREVRLSGSAVRQSDTAQLGSRILAAIHRAEAEIRTEQREGLAKIFRHVADD